MNCREVTGMNDGGPMGLSRHRGVSRRDRRLGRWWKVALVVVLTGAVAWARMRWR